MNRRAGATTAEDTEEERGASAAEQRQQSPTDLCEMMTDGASAFASLRGWSLPFAPPGAASPSHALPSGRPALCERQHCIRKSLDCARFAREGLRCTRTMSCGPQTSVQPHLVGPRMPRSRQRSRAQGNRCEAGLRRRCPPARRLAAVLWRRAVPLQALWRPCSQATANQIGKRQRSACSR
ncbi:unnamed protein product [Prorocentrum cordatum]|uniref:Uncharacterized protein n=1 Tax=Prorocentrum cordatum TaxID=2364126 RepID=A0ABN9WV04_9DINO|nr:unnamed protein product [Polarella glacialis]